MALQGRADIQWQWFRVCEMALVRPRVLIGLKALRRTPGLQGNRARCCVLALRVKGTLCCAPVFRGNIVLDYVLDLLTKGALTAYWLSKARNLVQRAMIADGSPEGVCHRILRTPNVIQYPSAQKEHTCWNSPIIPSAHRLSEAQEMCAAY